VTEGQTLDIDRLDLIEGNTVEIDRVLLLGNEGKETIGTPVIEGARVLATVQKNGRNSKIIVFKFKAKSRYRRKKGHHQLYTRLLIDKILPPGAAVEAKPARKPRRTTKKEVTADGA